MRTIGGSIAVSPEATVEFERKFISPWVAEHPLGDVTFVRESPIAQFAEQSRVAGDVFQSVGTMEELAIGLSQQARIYLADLPRQVRGEIDLLRSDVLPAENLASMQGDLHLGAASVDRLASAVETISTLVPSERQIVLDEMSRQRTLVMDAVSVERQQTISAITLLLNAERNELLRNVELHRLATIEWATAERRATIEDARRELAAAITALRGERAVVISDLSGIIDLVLLRVAIFVVAGVLLAPLVAHAYARVWPRQPRRPRA